MADTVRCTRCGYAGHETDQCPGRFRCARCREEYPATLNGPIICADCIAKDRPAATPGERLREMVPEKLRDAYHEDSTVEACFATAAYGGLSRESALIQCVLELRKQVASLRYEGARQLYRRGIPTIAVQAPVTLAKRLIDARELLEVLLQHVPSEHDHLRRGIRDWLRGTTIDGHEHQASPTPVVHLRPETLALLKRFVTEWTDQEGCGSHVLDELAAAARRDLEPPRYVALLRRFVREWSGTENDALGERFGLLLELCEAFEEAELQT